MREHVAPAVYYLEVHLLYASIVCLAAWLLTSLWKGSATWKYWVWVVTLLNFMLPLAGFLDRFGASAVSWATQLPVLDEVGIQISRHPRAGSVLFGIWLCGAAMMAARLWARIRHERVSAQIDKDRSNAALARAFSAQGVPVRFSASGQERQEPSVAGVLRPMILLPFGTEQLLSKQELDAVLLHELTHARRRDNLIGLLYEIAVCGLWFHPLVWLTGLRLAMFREFSCDDRVIARSRGADLVSAMAKLATPGRPQGLRAGATTLFSHRLSRLTASGSAAPNRKAAALPVLLYSAIFVGCIIETIAHTGSCFKIHF